MPPNPGPESAVAPRPRPARPAGSSRASAFRRSAARDARRAGEEGPEAAGGHGPAAAPAGSRDPSAEWSPDAVARWDRLGAVSDGGRAAAVVGACQKTDLETIGAVSAVRRSFASAANSAAATQVVAEFADEVGVAGARGAPRLAGGLRGAAGLRPQGRSLRNVAVRAGSGENYRTDYGPQSAERGWATGLGIVRRGSHLSVVELRTAASAYPSGRDPSRMAVRRIARTFA